MEKWSSRKVHYLEINSSNLLSATNNIMNKVLFLSDSNGFEYSNPKVWLIEFSSKLSLKAIELVHDSIPMRTWGKSVDDLRDKIEEIFLIHSNQLYYGYRDQLINQDWEFEFKLASGNY